MAPTTPKKRRAFTDLERRNIRQRYVENPGPQSALISWFTGETGHQINQSQISKILSKNYEYLDGPTRNTTTLGAKRHHQGDWPELEAALFEWQQRMQKKKATITGDVLKGKARELWDRLPQFDGLDKPRWSSGWLDGFKKRFKIKEYVQHGEAASADINNPEIIKQMNDLRELCATYADRDIFNMDETGLFWKLTPNRTLATEARSGGKKSKDRVTVALTTNGDGTERLEPWIIGQSKNPRCFKNINRKLLRIEYRNNKSKWMTGMIMEEYLWWFDAKMRGRKVLLLLDNFSGHELGVELVGGLDGLDNTRIAWLPPNTTSHWQPLDQGIIATFKLYYRKQWIAYMLRQYEGNKDPNQTVSLLKAVQWCRVAWNQCVSAKHIQQCFWKATIIKKPVVIDNVEPEDTSAEIDELRAQIASLPYIDDYMSVQEFVDPADELIDDKDDNIMASVIDRYSRDKEDEVDEVESSDIEDEEVSTADAIRALELLKMHQLKSKYGSALHLSNLDKLGRDLMAEKYSGGKQSTIEKYYTVAAK